MPMAALLLVAFGVLALSYAYFTTPSQVVYREVVYVPATPYQIVFPERIEAVLVTPTLTAGEYTGIAVSPPDDMPPREYKGPK